jgi:hypothetical protein
LEKDGSGLGEDVQGTVLADRNRTKTTLEILMWTLMLSQILEKSQGLQGTAIRK